MKRNDLIKEITKNGYYLVRHGSNHDVYTNGQRMEAVPRHREISEPLAKEIIKRTQRK